MKIKLYCPFDKTELQYIPDDELSNVESTIVLMCNKFHINSSGAFLVCSKCKQHFLVKMLVNLDDKLVVVEFHIEKEITEDDVKTFKESVINILSLKK